MELGAKQKDILAEFRKAVCDVKKPCEHDEYLLQWLRARNFDLQKSEDMLRQSMAWREKIGADDLIESWVCPEVLSKYIPLGVTGIDKEGCPVFIIPTGILDMIGLLKSCPVDDIVTFSAKNVEIGRLEMARQSKLRGKFVGQTVPIVDLECFSFRNATYPPALYLLKKLIRVCEDNYPEIMKKVIVINAPRFFAFLFNIWKHFMNEYTRSKISVYDSDRTKWVPAILEFVDPDQLPKHWGGTMVDPDGDPKCPSIVNLGGVIPESYYMSSKKTDENGKLMEAATIKSGDKLEVDVYIAQSGSKISWKIRTEGYDIAFGIFSMDGNNDRQEVLPCTLLDCCDTTVRGQTHSLDEGKYVVIFDNSYSKLRRKYVHYSIEVLPPSSENHTDM